MKDNPDRHLPLYAGVAPGCGVGLDPGVGTGVTLPPVICPGGRVGIPCPVICPCVGLKVHLGTRQQNGSLGSGTNVHSFGMFW